MNIQTDFSLNDDILKLIFRIEFKSENFWHITFYENKNWQVSTPADTTVTYDDSVTRQEIKSRGKILSGFYARAVGYSMLIRLRVQDTPML